MSDSTVERLQPNEISAAAIVLSHAFLTQPNNIAVWRGQGDSVRRKIESLFRIAKLERPVSNFWAARLDSQIVGVLNMTEWPHCQISALESLRLMPRMLALFGGALLRAVQIQSAWGRHDPHQQHWHLGPIGVLPQFQRQGIGSRLLERCCEIADQQMEGAYLETDKPENVPFYERFGFVVTAKESVLDVPNWFMWRSPR